MTNTKRPPGRPRLGATPLTSTQRTQKRRERLQQEEREALAASQAEDKRQKAMRYNARTIMAQEFIKQLRAGPKWLLIGYVPEEQMEETAEYLRELCTQMIQRRDLLP